MFFLESSRYLNSAVRYGTMLEELMQDENHAKMVEHFVVHEKFEQNDKELCEILEIYPRDRNKIIQKLLDVGLIFVTREIASTRFYLVDPKSRLLKPLRILIHDLSARGALKEAESQLEEEYFKDRPLVAFCPKCGLESRINDKSLKLGDENAQNITIKACCGHCNLNFVITYDEIENR